MTSYVDATAGAVEHCEAMAKEYPDLAEAYYDKIASTCKQKLWHQLTLTVLDFVSDPKTVRTTPEGTHSYLALYDKVVLSIDSKLNPLSLARIASSVAAALAVQDMTAAKAVLENLLAKKDDLQVSPTIYLQSKLNMLTLQPLLVDNNSSIQDDAVKQEVLKGIKATIQKNAEILNQMMVEPDNTDQALVNAAHYEQAMTYYKVVGPPEAFYEQAMQFLNYAPPPTTTTTPTPTTTSSTTTNYHQLAVDLILAALTGEGVYNLGQVEQNPVLTMLETSNEKWLVQLLKSCAAGDVVGFQQLTQQYATEIAAQPALVHRATAVQEKLTLLALVHLVFTKSSHERTLEFTEIAETLHIPLEQVEWVVMRALSVHLMEGSLDQVDQTVTVTWVLPRVLNNEQMQDLANRFGEWAVKVSQTKDYMQEQTPTIA